MQPLPKAFWVKTRLNTVLFFFLIIWIIIFQHLVEDFRNDLIQILSQYVTSGSWIERSLVTCLLKPKAVSFVTKDRSSEANEELCSAFPCWECLSHVSSDLPDPFCLPEPLTPIVSHYAYSICHSVLKHLLSLSDHCWDWRILFISSIQQSPSRVDFNWCVCVWYCMCAYVSVGALTYV